MKKTMTTICLLALVIMMMSGCGGSDGTGWIGNTLCTDEAILSQLKNDNSPELVLDGKYYALPASAGEFIGNGWTMTIDDYEDQEVILQPNERVSVTFAKDGNTVSAVLANDSQLPLKAENSNVVEVRLYVSASDQADFLITKYGITGTTSAKDAKSVLKDKEGFKESSDKYYLVSEGNHGSRDILYYSKDNSHTYIKIASDEEWAYRRYKPLEQKVQEQADNIAAYKKDAEQNCPKNYDEIVKSLADAATLHTVPFYSIDGTIVAKGTGKYEGMEDNIIYGQDLFLYAVQDKSGQIYCINEGFGNRKDLFKLPDLVEGDVISIWGFALEITKFEDGFETPTVVPKIVEKDGETIYLADELQVN